MLILLPNVGFRHSIAAHRPGAWIAVISYAAHMISGRETGL